MANITGTSLDLSDLNAGKAKFMLPNTITLAVYIVVGCLSNLMVLLVYIFRMGDTLKERFFIPVLATIDLVTIIVTTSFNLTLNTLSDMYPGSAACKSLIYFSYLTTITSMGVLLLIAVQRYKKVCQPLKPQMTLRLKVISIGIVVIVVAVFHVPVLFFYGVIPKKNKKYNITTFKCTKLPGSEAFDTGVTTFQALGVVVTMGAMLCVIVLYAFIGKVIFTQLKPSGELAVKRFSGKPKVEHVEQSSSTDTCVTSVKPDTLGGNTSIELSSTVSPNDVNKKSSSKTEKSRIKFTKYRFTYMFMAISFLALVTNIPPWTFIIMESKDPLFWTKFKGWNFHVALFFRRIYILDHVLNPIIYGLFDLRFRKELKKLFCRCLK